MIYVNDRGNPQHLEKQEEILHTGSGGAFEEAESPTDEAEREMSDEQLDERLENTPQQNGAKRPSY